MWGFSINNPLLVYAASKHVNPTLQENLSLWYFRGNNNTNDSISSVYLMGVQSSTQFLLFGKSLLVCIVLYNIGMG